MILRHLQARLLAALTGPRKVVVLYGPRQVGKTTLLREIVDATPGLSRVLNGDFVDDQRLLRPERAALHGLLAGVDHLFVDEAQSIPDVGTSLKLIHDHFPDVRVLATGSSSFDLARRTGEPLTGRQVTFLLYPVSYAEQSPDPTTSRALLEQAMVFGSYPEILGMADPGTRRAHLRQLVADYLLKDIFANVDVNRAKLLDILRVLAFQIGDEVSLSEVGRTVQLDTKTVARYVDLLEDAFVIRRLRGFSRNLRKEVGKSQKMYFVDLGIRNAVVQAFQPIPLRDDVGKLWENLLVIERIKRNEYAAIDARYWFWRTYDRQEIDLIEERADRLVAFEMKWSAGRARIPKLWRATYPESETAIVDPESAPAFLAMP